METNPPALFLQALNTDTNTDHVFKLFIYLFNYLWK